MSAAVKPVLPPSGNQAPKVTTTSSAITTATTVSGKIPSTPSVTTNSPAKSSPNTNHAPVQEPKAAPTGGTSTVPTVVPSNQVVPPKPQEKGKDLTMKPTSNGVENAEKTEKPQPPAGEKNLDKIEEAVAPVPTVNNSEVTAVQKPPNTTTTTTTVAAAAAPPAVVSAVAATTTTTATTAPATATPQAQAAPAVPAVQINDSSEAKERVVNHAELPATQPSRKSEEESKSTEASQPAVSKPSFTQPSAATPPTPPVQSTPPKAASPQKPPPAEKPPEIGKSSAAPASVQSSAPSTPKVVASCPAPEEPPPALKTTLPEGKKESPTKDVPEATPPATKSISTLRTTKRKREPQVESRAENKESKASKEKPRAVEQSEERKSKRTRTQTQPYQSPLPEMTYIPKFKPAVKAPEDKLIVFYKNEFLAVRNAEGSFYVCQTMQNIYKTSPRIRIRWLSQVQTDAKKGDVYSPDFYDFTDFDCILTNLNLEKQERNKFRLPKEELLRTESILKRALDVEKGVAEKPSVTEEHPDGLDLSLYTDEAQLKKKKAAKKGTKGDKGDEEDDDDDEEEEEDDEDSDEEEEEEQKPEKTKNAEKPPEKQKKTEKSSEKEKDKDKEKEEKPKEKERVREASKRKGDNAEAKEEYKPPSEKKLRGPPATRKADPTPNNTTAQKSTRLKSARTVQKAQPVSRTKERRAVTLNKGKKKPGKKA